MGPMRRGSYALGSDNDNDKVCCCHCCCCCSHAGPGTGFRAPGGADSAVLTQAQLPAFEMRATSSHGAFVPRPMRLVDGRNGGNDLRSPDGTHVVGWRGGGFVDIHGGDFGVHMSHTHDVVMNSGGQSAPVSTVPAHLPVGFIIKA